MGLGLGCGYHMLRMWLCHPITSHQGVCAVLPSTETSDMQSNSSHSAVKRSWWSKAYTIGYEQLPWPMPYNSLSVVPLYEAYDTPNPVAKWCSSWAQSRSNIHTEFLDYPIRRNMAKAMPLTIRS
jgi:hypothetical protein